MATRRNAKQIGAVIALSLQLAGVTLASVISRGASAQSASPPVPTALPLGTWRGSSTCLVRPSACTDEIVLYRITQMQAADSLEIDARRIVRGEEQAMGPLECRLTPSSGLITCSVPRGVWRFTVRNDSLTGELRLRDNTRFRNVRAVRAP